MFFKRDLTNLDSSAVVVITRPPEIIACLKLRLSTRNVFIIFDSHPRPSYPNGAGAIASTSVEGTARRLTELLPSVDLQDGILQWQAQLLSNCSGHVFVPHTLDSSTAALWQSVLESSLAQLSMQAEISDLRSQNDFQVSEQKRLEAELKEVEERCQRQERSIQELRSSRNNAYSHHHAPNPQLHSSSSSTSRPISSNNPFTILGRHTTTSHSTSSRSAGSAHDPRRSSPPLFDWDGSFASRMQDEFDSEDRALTTERADLSRYATSHTTSPRSVGPHDTRGGSSAHRDDPFSFAKRLQSQFDNEDRELSAQRIKLSQTIQPVFECGVCMEEMPEDSVARPDPCRHSFCRECMRGYVSARLEEHRFPILCPTCTADKGKGKGVTGGTRMFFPSLVTCLMKVIEVSQSLALDLGLTDEQFNIWTEMEMVSFSVLLHCQKYVRGIRSHAY